MGTGKKFVKRRSHITSTLNPNHTANAYILIVTKKLSTLQLSISANIESTPRPRATLLVCLKKYSAIEKSAIENYVVLCSKLILKTVLLEVSYGKND